MCSNSARPIPQQRAILNDYLSAIPLSGGAVALEIGCGTGAVSRALAQLAGVKEVVGIDPSPVFIDQARASPRTLEPPRSTSVTVALFRLQLTRSISVK